MFITKTARKMALIMIVGIVILFLTADWVTDTSGTDESMVALWVAERVLDYAPYALLIPLAIATLSIWAHTPSKSQKGRKNITAIHRK